METTISSRLGTALIENGYLTQEKLNEALSEQKRTGRMLGQVLIDSRDITEEQMSRSIAAQQNLPFIDLLKYDVTPEIVRLLTESQVRRFRAIVLEDRIDTFLVGLVDPSNLRAQDELSSLLGRPIYASVITNDQFKKTMDRIFHKDNQLDEYANEVKQDLERDRGIVDLNQMSHSIDAIEAPVIKLLQTVFEEAVKLRASDIHIEPEENKLEVRFRIDGELHHQFDADITIAPALMVRLKLLAGLDIAEKRLPMDGRISVKTGTERVDIRMSTIPTQFGESVVMRLLIQSQGLLDLNKIGMSLELLAKFNRLIKLPHGIVLVTGPTGCGKTTTLYGALEKLNRRNVKILTCEDPVEYRIPGIRQVQVNEKIELTFSRVLRSFLRQDPDILMVGEIRDLETAQIAARAAMTGHMVLSTLHTNDAVTAPGRLLDMGVPGYMIASTLLGVLSQRLLRLLCTYCAESYTPTSKELEWVKHFHGAELTQANFRQSKGCPRCNGIGFNDRIGVFELLEMTAPLYEAIHKGDPLNFARVAREMMGSDTIENQAMNLAICGKTTIVEAMTVVSSVEF
jgi:MSHA biogenesis protein MshE